MATYTPPRPPSRGTPNGRGTPPGRTMPPPAREVPPRRPARPRPEDPGARPVSAPRHTHPEAVTLVRIGYSSRTKPAPLTG